MPSKNISTSSDFGEHEFATADHDDEDEDDDDDDDGDVDGDVDDDVDDDVDVH